jgi:hypothetical protein
VLIRNRVLTFLEKCLNLTLLENSWNSAEIYILLENHPGILMFLE